MNEESVSLTTNYTWTEIALLPYPWCLFSKAESMDTSSKCYPGYLLERDCFTDSYPVIPAYNLHDASWKITRKHVQRIHSHARNEGKKNRSGIDGWDQHQLSPRRSPLPPSHHPHAAAIFENPQTHYHHHHHLPKSKTPTFSCINFSDLLRSLNVLIFKTNGKSPLSER